MRAANDYQLNPSAEIEIRVLSEQRLLETQRMQTETLEDLANKVKR